jgi:hypothetical protein
MTEFTAKKLGEVLAFAEVGVETFEKGKEALGTVFEGMDGVDGAIEDSRAHAAEIERVATEAGMMDAVRTKADGTGKKLRAMRDLYVADQWDNATELMEWHGFFEGAAIVHWSLVKGAAEGMDSEELHTLTLKSHDFHNEILDTINVKITAYAKGKESGTA